MRLLIGFLFAFAVAAAFGLGLTQFALTRGTAFGAITDGDCAERRAARQRELREAEAEGRGDREGEQKSDQQAHRSSFRHQLPRAPLAADATVSGAGSAAPFCEADASASARVAFSIMRSTRSNTSIERLLSMVGRTAGSVPPAD